MRKAHNYLIVLYLLAITRPETTTVGRNALNIHEYTHGLQLNPAYDITLPSFMEFYINYTQTINL